MVTYEDNGDGTSTFSFEVTKPTEITLNFLNNCAQGIYLREPFFVQNPDGQYSQVPYDELTAAQRRDLIDKAIKVCLSEFAREYELLLLNNTAFDTVMADPNLNLNI